MWEGDLSPAENPKPALTGAILVVEDEILIRLDTADYLRAQGFAVVEASNAHEAIEILGSGVSISVVFTDVRMPGSLDGVDLAKHIVSNYPRILVMITSGHVRAEDITPGLPAPITKPYSLTKLVETINRHWSGKNE